MLVPTATAMATTDTNSAVPRVRGTRGSVARPANSSAPATDTLRYSVRSRWRPTRHRR
jgi:hypothetical protein